jgi:vacuolar-type H+-ATPase subunit C/Vma6
VIASGQRAFANARVRALKSHLLTGDPRRAGSHDLHPVLDLVDCYRTVLVSLPVARSLTLTLFDRVELENVKLLWRAVARGHAPRRWLRLWRPLKTLARISLDIARECTSLSQIVDALVRTPYGEVASAMWRGHRDDVLAADLGFDQWMAQRLWAAAMALDDREILARELVGNLVGEADLNLLRRGVSTYGWSADVVAGAVVVLSRVMPPERLAAIATWTPARGGFAALWPHVWRRIVAAASDWDALMLQWRRARYQTCRRAFSSEPFSVAPAIALLLLVEEEARAVAALAQCRDDAAARPSLAFALAASAMGQ